MTFVKSNPIQPLETWEREWLYLQSRILCQKDQLCFCSHCKFAVHYFSKSGLNWDTATNRLGRRVYCLWQSPRFTLRSITERKAEIGRFQWLLCLVQYKANLLCVNKESYMGRTDWAKIKAPGMIRRLLWVANSVEGQFSRLEYWQTNYACIKVFKQKWQNSSFNNTSPNLLKGNYTSLWTYRKPLQTHLEGIAAVLERTGRW